MTPADRQIMLKQLIEQYGEAVIFPRLNISRRTFDLYLKPKIEKMVPYFKLRRISNDLSRAS